MTIRRGLDAGTTKTASKVSNTMCFLYGSSYACDIMGSFPPSARPATRSHSAYLHLEAAGRDSS